MKTKRELIFKISPLSTQTKIIKAMSTFSVTINVPQVNYREYLINATNANMLVSTYLKNLVELRYEYIKTYSAQDVYHLEFEIDYFLNGGHLLPCPVEPIDLDAAQEWHLNNEYFFSWHRDYIGGLEVSAHRTPYCLSTS